MPARKPRCLIVWQDHLLADTQQVVVDYLGTGTTITPFGTSERAGLGYFVRVTRCALRLLFRRYDLIILPAIDFSWQWDTSRMGRWARKLLAWLLALKPGGRTPLFRWFVPRHGLVAVLDRYDSDAILDDYARLVGANVYLKTNLLSSRQIRSDVSGMKLEVLPYGVFSERYAGPAEAKDVDLFYSTTLNSEVRRRAADEVAQLKSDGLRVVDALGRLPLDEYLAYMQRSYLTLSPEGYGYHCFRHYEAMLSGSIPVINRHQADYVTDLQDGKNCLLYNADCPGDLARVVKNALRNPSQLRLWGQQLRQFALENHSMSAVGRRILKSLAASTPQPA
jgi:hypothetical protein